MTPLGSASPHVELLHVVVFCALGVLVRAGSFPPELGGLTAVKFLDISSNKLSGKWSSRCSLSSHSLWPLADRRRFHVVQPCHSRRWAPEPACWPLRQSMRSLKVRNSVPVYVRVGFDLTP